MSDNVWALSALMVDVGVPSPYFLRIPPPSLSHCVALLLVVRAVNPLIVYWPMASVSFGAVI